jgi:hypothetical protein
MKTKLELSSESAKPTRLRQSTFDATFLGHHGRLFAGEEGRLSLRRQAGLPFAG